MVPVFSFKFQIFPEAIHDSDQASRTLSKNIHNIYLGTEYNSNTNVVCDHYSFPDAFTYLLDSIYYYLGYIAYIIYNSIAITGTRKWTLRQM